MSKKNNIVNEKQIYGTVPTETKSETNYEFEYKTLLSELNNLSAELEIEKTKNLCFVDCISELNTKYKKQSKDNSFFIKRNSEYSSAICELKDILNNADKTDISDALKNDLINLCNKF